MPPRRTQAAEAHSFLRDLFGDAPPERPGLKTRIALWEKAEKKSTYWMAAEPAARHAAGKPDVYVSVSLAPKDLGARRRILNATSAGIPGLWADVDVNGGPEKKAGAAPDLEAALELVTEVLAPTITLTSGYGLQAWWLFEEPWVFGTGDEREQAARLAAGWIALLDERARARGFGIDHTQDLARLMRVPGTVNAKGGQEAEVLGWPEPVSVQDGPRYQVEEVAPLVAGKAPSGSALKPQLALADGYEFDPQATPPADKLLALLENSEQFKKTWRHTRRDGEGWTMSEWDLSLASQAAAVEWTDPEISALLAYHRRENGGEKLDRPDYFEKTIAKARTSLGVEARERDRDEALDELAELSEQPRPDEAATISAFNRVVGNGAPQVREFVQDGRDPATARFQLVMGNGDHVRLGRVDGVLAQERFRGAFLVVTGYVLPKVKGPKWDSAVQALFRIRQVRESEDDTLEGTVADWLARYLYERLPPHPGDDAKDQACRAKEPFEEDGLVHVYAESFVAFARAALRVTMPADAIREMLRAAGFERRTVHYQREDGVDSTRSYYAGQREGLE